MRHWYDIFPRNTGLSLYIWIIFCVLPFYFIFRSTSLWEVAFGIAATMIFFGVYWVTFNSRGPLVYIGLSIEFLIHSMMTILFQYVYFALFTAFFIGNIRSKAGFITMYVIHLVISVGAMTTGFLLDYTSFLSQIPFLIMTILGIILIPINRYNRLKQEALEGQLEDANKKIAQLAIIEERHRIARDLHDTLGQKLSLIGLKSELSAKLMEKNTVAARKELQDIQDTARHALKEVREMVSNMRNAKLLEEFDRAKELLNAAGIEQKMMVEADCEHLPLFLENVLSMCLKEAVTNVAKHSHASSCSVYLTETKQAIQLVVVDNGIGHVTSKDMGNGLKGMKERLEFVNGTLDMRRNDNQFEVHLSVPKVLKQIEEGEEL
ncbi:sensor histidine kinase [Gracilibacillus sp. S3-1-1]|uniref:Sensor histidine kinase n=1 Tax=Gracilibacillus pellucidus TaxID=3095368 RepID=A0ACC6M603_9BACI|nr:sensor histidine kinase [Gracilibacillus sp. S3-1-1]MDX8046404.1 sensor histidine kinase [Gracilibacillus sp. S3-1-1]